MSRIAVAMFGSSQPPPGERLYELSYTLGFSLTKAGFDLINGGHEGTMEAAARGVREGGGHVTGVTCAALRPLRAARINPYCSTVLHAASLFERIEIMMRRAGGYIVLEGGTGTLAELGLIWEHLRAGLIAPRPLVLVGDFWRPLVELLDGAAEDAGRFVTFAHAADEVVGLLQAQAVAVSPADAAFQSRESQPAPAGQEPQA